MGNTIQKRGKTVTFEQLSKYNWTSKNYQEGSEFREKLMEYIDECATKILDLGERFEEDPATLMNFCATTFEILSGTEAFAYDSPEEKREKAAKESRKKFQVVDNHYLR